MDLYKLVPQAAFHFGERGIGIEETAPLPHSDTLFSALVSAWALRDGADAARGLVAPFPQNGNAGASPPFRISSAFPYAGDTLFLPRPSIRIPGPLDDEKLSKRILYVSWRRMESLLSSATPLRAQADDLLQNGQLWVTPQERQDLGTKFGNLRRFRAWVAGERGVVPRVSLDRITSASAIYFQGQVRFHEGCGMFVLVEFDVAQETTYRPVLKRGLEFLGDLGLGGRRTAGLGAFTLQHVGEITPPGPRQAEAHLLLSLYHPTRAEVGVLQGSRYDLIVRRGWIFSPKDAGQRRRGLRMLAEGAVLASPVTGDVVNVAPAGFTDEHHPVYRSGVALTAPCRRWADV